MPTSDPSVRLHVNVDHVATLRNARGTTYPDPVRAALICLEAGADGITAHLREDRRHIRDADIEQLRAALRGRTLNLEMAATAEMVGIACRVRPDVVTLVPEKREERTTEGGLEVAAAPAALTEHVKALKSAGIRVSLFIAPDRKQIEASRRIGAVQVELHTGEYAHAHAHGEAPEDIAKELGLLRDGAALAHGLSLEVAAGHGLTQANVVGLMAIAEIVELNIGHAIVSDAVFLSLKGAVAAFRAAIDEGTRKRQPQRLP